LDCLAAADWDGLIRLVGLALQKAPQWESGSASGVGATQLVADPMNLQMKPPWLSNGEAMTGTVS